jgi:hypothetical protein
MFYRKVLGFVAVLAVSLAGITATFAADSEKRINDQKSARILTPLNIAILIQDDLVSQVGNELEITRQFIRSLPAGSRVMTAYITSGSLQVRQPFTTDLDSAARSLRIPLASRSASPFNPYVEVVEALRKFDAGWKGTNAVLLISDGLDTSRGFDSTAAANTVDLHRAIEHANRRNVAVYSFYAPSVGLTSQSRLAASYGQSSLNRLSRETGGKAFFQGTTGFVSFDSHFRRLREALNAQYAMAN